MVLRMTVDGKHIHTSKSALKSDSKGSASKYEEVALPIYFAYLKQILCSTRMTYDQKAIWIVYVWKSSRNRDKIILSEKEVIHYT